MIFGLNIPPNPMDSLLKNGRESQSIPIRAASFSEIEEVRDPVSIRNLMVFSALIAGTSKKTGINGCLFMTMPKNLIAGHQKMST
jgi:hypothetical protein